MSKELLFSITKKDFEIDYFSGTGAGGQHRNKHQNCVRLKHIASGATATGQNHRDRKSNLRDAFVIITNHPLFKLWFHKEIYKMSEQYKVDQQDIEDKVDEAMKEKNLRVEYI